MQDAAIVLYYQGQGPLALPIVAHSYSVKEPRLFE